MGGRGYRRVSGAIRGTHATGPFDARGPHERDARSGNAGVTQHAANGVAKLLDRLRKRVWICLCTGDNTRDGDECRRENCSHARKCSRKLYWFA